jgi:DNA repair exonuclease SbcCD nuclease subunit
MKILLIGDPHLKINRFELATQFLAWLDKTITEVKPDIVVNLGDTFDTHAIVRSEVLCEFMNHVDVVLKLGIPYVYLLGNHDMYKPNDAQYHALKPFKNRIKDFHVVDEIQELFGMTFVPYQHNPDTFPRNTLPICIAHQTMLGADYGAIRANDGVAPSSIKGCEIIISGHIHTKQRVLPNGGSGPEVLYVGSPFSQSASDVDQVKGITIFDSTTYGETFYQAPLPSWRRLHVVVSQQTTLEHVHQMVEQDVKGSKDHWVVELEGPKAELIGYLGSKEYKNAVKDVDVKVKTTFTDKEKRNVAIEAKSMESIISDYIVKVYSGSLDKTKLFDVAKSVLNDSKLSE